MSGCTNRPRCVNCRGSHVAGSRDCPRETYLIERNRLILEARTLQQVRSTTPAAFISTQSQSPHDSHPEGNVLKSGGTPDVSRKTFASVVRSIAIGDEGSPAPVVVLPKPRPIPQKRRRVTRTHHRTIRALRKPVTNRKKGAGKRKVGGLGQLSNLSSLANLIQCFSPQAAEAVRKLATILQPLLSIAQVLQGVKSPISKT